MYFIQFHSVNVKRNWIHIAQKHSLSIQYLGYHENILILLVLP